MPRDRAGVVRHARVLVDRSHVFSRGGYVSGTFRYEYVGTALVLLAFLPPKRVEWRERSDKKVAIASDVPRCCAHPDREQVRDRRRDLQARTGAQADPTEPHRREPGCRRRPRSQTGLRRRLQRLTAAQYRVAVARYGTPDGTARRNPDAAIVDLANIFPRDASDTPSVPCVPITEPTGVPASANLVVPRAERTWTLPSSASLPNPPRSARSQPVRPPRSRSQGSRAGRRGRSTLPAHASTSEQPSRRHSTTRRSEPKHQLCRVPEHEVADPGRLVPPQRRGPRRREDRYGPSGVLGLQARVGVEVGTQWNLRGHGDRDRRAADAPLGSAPVRVYVLN